MNLTHENSVMENEFAFLPSRRGIENLHPTLMFDLQRIVEKIPAYNAKTNPTGLIDIAGSVNVLMQPDSLKYSKKYICSAAENSLQYSWTAGSPQLLDGVANYLNKYYSPSVQVKPSQIMATNGVSALLSILAFNLCDLGEGIMYPVPEYGMFAHDISAQNGLRIIEVKMTSVGDRFRSENSQATVEEFRSALRRSEKQGIKVKALLLSNPCNPLGRSYSRETLIALAIFCREEGLHFVSDEIYALSTIGRTAGGLDAFTSVLSLREDEGVTLENIHCLSGVSKDFGMGGLRLGFLITRNDLVRTAVRKLGAFTWVNSFADKFFSAFLVDEVHLAKFLNQYHRRLKIAHEQATTFLSANSISYDPANSGIFLWIDLSSWLVYFTHNIDSPELMLTYYLIDKGVYLEPGEAFSSPHPGKFRLVYAAAETCVLSIALRRLVQALEELRHVNSSKVSLSDGESDFTEKQFVEPSKIRGVLGNISSCFRI